MFRRRQERPAGGSRFEELCRASVKVPQTSVLQELGHHHSRPRSRATDRVQTHALVRLYDNGRSPVHGGRYCLVTVGGDMDPYPTFPVDSVTAGYRVFLLVQAVIAAGKMDADGRTNTTEAILAREENVFTRWACQAVGRDRFLRIWNFPVSQMPPKVQAAIRGRTGGS